MAPKMHTDRLLRYRRQFLLSTERITGLRDWKYLTVDRYHLYCHPDLEISSVTNAERTIVLMGCIFDAARPERKDVEILTDILAHSLSMEEALLCLKPYAGRYVVILRDQQHCFLVQDARALREAYYCTTSNRIVCGSQPNLIVEYSSPKLDSSMNGAAVKFYKSEMINAQWVGDETCYLHVKHLLPSHYLDLHALRTCRYWPNESFKPVSLNVAVEKSCEYIRGIIKAVTQRHQVMMAVTAGIDSRTLLAASRDNGNQIYYFINKERDLTYESADIAVPRRMLMDVGVPFHIHDVPNEVDREFRAIFLQNCFLASERILPTIYNVYFKQHSDKVNILGLGEVGRTRYGRQPSQLNAYYLAYALGYKASTYAVQQCHGWLSDVGPAARKYNANILNLLYLEQRAGNWGAVGNSESDIAIEEVDPFNSHFLLELFYSVDEKFTDYNRCILYQEMIRRMWPELLDYPVNPPETVPAKAAFLLKSIGLYGSLKSLRYRVNYARYRAKRGRKMAQTCA